MVGQLYGVPIDMSEEERQNLAEGALAPLGKAFSADGKGGRWSNRIDGQWTTTTVGQSDQISNRCPSTVFLGILAALQLFLLFNMS